MLATRIRDAHHGKDPRAGLRVQLEILREGYGHRGIDDGRQERYAMEKPQYTLPVGDLGGKSVCEFEAQTHAPQPVDKRRGP